MYSNLKKDLETSETNNQLLTLSVQEQNQTIENLKNSFKEIQFINENLQENLTLRDESLFNMQESIDKLKELSKQDPIKANQAINNTFKDYYKCLTAITYNDLQNNSCSAFLSNANSVQQR